MMTAITAITPRRIGVVLLSLAVVALCAAPLARCGAQGWRPAPHRQPAGPFWQIASGVRADPDHCVYTSVDSACG